MDPTGIGLERPSRNLHVNMEFTLEIKQQMWSKISITYPEAPRMVYLPWASEPDKNVGFTSKPEVSKENPRFSKFMKFNDLIVCVKYQ